MPPLPVDDSPNGRATRDKCHIAAVADMVSAPSLDHRGMETRMSEFAKGPVVVLGPDEGESFWQPLPSRGYIVNKLTPYNTPHDGFSLGIEVLEPGAHIRRHAHERQHEVLFCYVGEGWAEVDGARHEVRPETTLLIGRAAWHTVRNTGSGQMRLLWMIAPAGLEDWFRAIGRPRRPGEAMPEAFERPADVAEIQARQRFVREG
jgi:mannose-6-phosphate isomerase-like protein (cupin superfamily)